ncbi:hypothetical protein H4R35_001197 [Dimargaris xerosporica]|nr:hypothetical protein H4R35_001197 [Dimargaris xerosporica]
MSLSHYHNRGRGDSHQGPSLLDRLWGDFDLWPGYDTALTRQLADWKDGVWSPTADMIDCDDQYVIHADLPGVRREQAQVSVVDDSIVISGEHKEEQQRDQEHTKIRERRFGRFRRSFPLPTNADADHIKAKFDNGVLEVCIPKASNKSSRRQITIV